jgi:FkbM family methyltransferase
MKRNIDGFIMYLDNSLTGTSGSLASIGHIEPELMWIFKHECCGELGIDAGASIGDTTLPMAKYMNKVIAFEPDRRSWKLLVKNIEANQMSGRVSVHCSALSDKCEEKIIYMNRHSDKSTLHGFRDGTYKERTVTTVTLDSLNVSPSFVKIDIEGFEIEALRGGKNCLRDAKQCKLLIDIHPDTYSDSHDFGRSLNDLFSLGFRFKYLVSAAKAVPEPFEKQGYKPKKVFEYAGYQRGLYDCVSQEDSFSFCALTQSQMFDGKLINKIIRTALLVKK